MAIGPSFSSYSHATSIVCFYLISIINPFVERPLVSASGLSTKITHCSTKITSLSMITRSLSTKITHCSTEITHCSTKITHCSTKITHCSTKITHCSMKITSLSMKITHCSTPLRKSRFFCRILSDIRPPHPPSALPSQKSPISSGFFCCKSIYNAEKRNIPHISHISHVN